MNADEMNLTRSSALKYLEQLQELTDEINAGLYAVGANELSAFQSSVVKQQEICASLCRLTDLDQMGRRESSLIAEPSDSDLDARILIAAESLQALNERYAALLKHSGESVRLFAGLCQSYRGLSSPPTALAAASRCSYEF